LIPLLNWADWLIVVVVGVSTLLSLWRGFVKEALSLAAWVAAFFVSIAFATRLSAVLHDVISNDGLRYAAAYVILFAITLMFAALLNRLFAQLIKMTGLSGLDRVLGTVFGFARGLVVVVVLVFIAQALAPEAQVIEESLLLPRVMMVVQWAEVNFSSLLDSGALPWRA
jgi:membrane protein required for colicin V production